MYIHIWSLAVEWLEFGYGVDSCILFRGSFVPDDQRMGYKTPLHSQTPSFFKLHMQERFRAIKLYPFCKPALIRINRCLLPLRPYTPYKES